MVTLEALMSAGMSEEEAKRILEIFNGESADTDENEEAEPPMADAAEEAEPAEAEQPAAGEPPDEAAFSEETEENSGESPADESAVTEEAAEAEASEQEPHAEPGQSAVNPLEEENAALRARVVESGLRVGALAAGVKPERLEAFFRLADVSGIDPMAADAQEQIDAAVQRALALVPELAMTAPAVTTGSAGMHPREPVNPIDPFSRGFRG